MEKEQKGDHDHAFLRIPRELSKEMGKGIESICITSLDLKFDEIFKRIHKSWVIKFAWSSLD